MSRYRHNSTFKVPDVATEQARLRRRREAVARGLGKVERVCGHCQKAFVVWRKQPGKACSRDCADKLRRTRVERTCKQCGAAFSFAPSQLNRYKGGGQFCSKPCANNWRITANANKPSPDRYGRTSRHADKEWQKQVREKDNYTCQRCGKYDLYIHTHHIAPRSRRPDLKHEVSNGKCLCGNCHQYVHHHPKEATLMGLLSDASYERAQKEKAKLACVLCGGKHAGLGYCGKHYGRFKKYGDPLLAGRQGHPGEAPHRVVSVYE